MEQPIEAMRRQAVTWALRVTAGTWLAPDPYERGLLEAYVRGDLTLGEAGCLLAARNKFPRQPQYPPKSLAGDQPGFQG